MNPALYITYAHPDSATTRFLDLRGGAPAWAVDVRDATPADLGLPSVKRQDAARTMSVVKKIGATALAVLDCVETQPGIVMITRINTPAKFRSQGIASSLLRTCLARADRLGVLTTLTIHASDGLCHDTLDAWYRRHGFEPRECGDGVYERIPRGTQILSADAATVVAAMDSGDWRVWRAPWQDFLTVEGNRRGSWVAERARAPYCAVRDGGEYGPRHWQGRTAIEALRAGCNDLGVDIGEYSLGVVAGGGGDVAAPANHINFDVVVVPAVKTP